MPHYLELEHSHLQRDPLILLVPGDRSPGPRHWQSLWEAQCSDCRRVDLGMWDEPHRNTWVNKLNIAIHQADRPVILVAHGLGCLAVAWWAEYEQPSYANPVVGALFAAPPDVDRPGSDPRLAHFGACPRKPLPFPGFLTANRGDTFCSLRTAQRLASDWGCRFVFGDQADTGAQTAGDWLFGKKLLGRLLQEHRWEKESFRSPHPATIGTGNGQVPPSQPWPRRA